MYQPGKISLLFPLFGILTAVLLLSFPACERTSETDEEGELMIRIHNKSSLTLKDILVGFPEDEVSYGNLAPGEKSEYRSVTKAYRYAYTEAVAGEKKMVIQPIDYVGESLLEPGMYTYELYVNEEMYNSENFRHALSVQLREEP